MSVRDRILAPQIVKVNFALEPAYNLMESLCDVAEVQLLHGFNEWVVKTALELSPERKRLNRLIFGTLCISCIKLPNDRTWESFPALVEEIASMNPVTLRDLLLQNILSDGHETIGRRIPPSPEQMLGSLETFLGWNQELFQHHEIDVEQAAWAHRLLNDPPLLQHTISTHLRVMWHEVLADEWKRHLSALQESVAAFSKIDYSGLTAYEVVREVTGRDLRGKWEDQMVSVEHITFVPSPHIGPYVSKYLSGTHLRMIFGVRMPKPAKSDVTEMSRAELLVRLNGLVDETRLRILELLRNEDEICGQDIIAALGLSQSSVSRHLSQLTATGYLIERRREVAKCYSLNTERIDDTLKALSYFLLKR
jgi:ArsR family transcriptional regulator